MTKRLPLAAILLLAVLAAGVGACADSGVPGLGTEASAPLAARSGNGGFEVWVADQSDTRPGYGGQLLVFAGSDLIGSSASQATPVTRLDLGAATAQMCFMATGRNPVRPHMLSLNTEQTHVVLSFVASGHVVVFDADTREPITCMETSQSPTGRQAHAAFAAPDGSFVLVANQNGKRLERIDTDFAANSYVQNPAATLDLATCVTPNGRPCEDPDLRPLNWPICPVIASDSRHVFVTLRGGGMLVVDATQTPMAIVAEYDRHTIHGNGCGGAEVGGDIYVNSGGSPVGVAPGDHHKFGFDVYKLPLSGYSASNAENLPAPTVVLSKTGETDSHGMIATRDERFLWVMDRFQNVVEVIDVRGGNRVSTIDMVGAASSDPSPDITGIAPAGNRVFAALRGPVPLSGDPHNSTGTTPGVGILHVTQGGRSGTLAEVVPITNPNQQGSQQPDPHGLVVRLTR